jgi:mono/diheme cytochrome c family protein
MKNKNLIVSLLALVSGAIVAMLPFQDEPKSIERGKDVYLLQCMSCHMESGEGLSGLYPPLAKSDYLMADPKRSIRELIRGLKGKIRVNGTFYDSEMPALDLSDEQIADVLNYVRNSWGNKGKLIRSEEVARIRRE